MLLCYHHAFQRTDCPPPPFLSILSSALAFACLLRFEKIFFHWLQIGVDLRLFSGEGGKATLVGAPDTDILAAAIEILRKRIAAGTATFLVKVKVHRGEPANEEADILADKAISDPKVGKGWCPSSLHVGKTVQRGRESNLPRSSFDIS